jgi:hypothetical protein
MRVDVVGEIKKVNFSMVAAGHHTAGQDNFLAFFKHLKRLRDGTCGFETSAIRIETFGFEGRQFFQADAAGFVIFEMRFG